MQLYIRSQDEFAKVMEKVGPDEWDNPSACAGWTVRDVVGHVVWGMDLVRTWAGGKEFDNTVGAPGAPRPRDYLGADPLADWTLARAACLPSLTPESLTTVMNTRNRGPIVLSDMVEAMTMDFTTHTWDLGRALGLTVTLDPELIEHAQRWAELNVESARNPAFFATALPTPADADPQTRLLRYLGRDA
ncbi:TIGR03086 family metal-binding protein [Nocardia transvalensis]|uniref:TIGR03086 family metal-binding protein n=1 Tax=Nocardia transvalensis TaxID=37333 RepID=UPI001893FF60|nr:TIGR03086 family metal-binding protein [Nocardia transvalensis]MBF6327692.1 TIGR03086 family protein [Nocardia transvalensis]